MRFGMGAAPGRGMRTPRGSASERGKARSPGHGGKERRRRARRGEDCPAARGAWFSSIPMHEILMSTDLGNVSSWQIRILLQQRLRLELRSLDRHKRAVKTIIGGMVERIKSSQP